MSEFQDLDREYQELTGQDCFLYATQPSPNGPTKYVFTDHQTTSRENALEYLRLKVATARTAQAGRPDTTATGVRQPSGGVSDAT